MIQTLLISSTMSLRVSGSLHVYSLKNPISPFLGSVLLPVMEHFFASKTFLADFQDNGV